MDLSKLSDADLMAMKSGDLSKVSDAGLMAMKGGGESPVPKDEGFSAATATANAIGNVWAGATRGAGSIGSTLLAPYDMAKDALDGKGLSLESNRRRRDDIDATLRDFGADTDSLAYGGAKLVGEIAGTAGAGGLLAKALTKVAPTVAANVPALVEALRSGGFSAQGAGMGTRAAAGAAAGAASAGLVDPSNAVTGAVVGGALPPAVKGAEFVSDALARGLRAAPEKLMYSAVKPTLAQHTKGEADIAVRTLLDRGINPTKGGVTKLHGLIDDVDNRITADIAASPATIDKQAVLARVGDTRSKFSKQVSPTDDLASIKKVEDDFLAHPMYAGAAIPVQGAQDLKRGTYKVLQGKYGEAGSAATEAQKALARGLKEEIATAVPSVQPLNAELSKLVTTLGVAERRALMDANKNPGGLSLLAANPGQWAAFMADKSALFKSVAARMLNGAVGPAPSASTGNQQALAAALRARALATAPVVATQD
jgi:hypothetical protein